MCCLNTQSLRINHRLYWHWYLKSLGCVIVSLNTFSNMWFFKTGEISQSCSLNMNLSCPRDIIVVKWIRLSCKAPPTVFDLHQPDAAFHAHAQLPSSHVPGWLCFACWSCFLRNSQEQRHEGKNSPRWEALRPYCVQDVLRKCERF